MSDGTEQRQRVPAAWAPRRFQVDELGLDRLIAICARLGAHLRRVDHAGHEVGTWGPWFDHDETFVLARMASVDRFGMRQSFLQWAGSAPEARMAHHVLELAQWLDGWWLALSGKPAPAALVRDSIGQLVERQLRAPLAEAMGQLGGAVWQELDLAAMHRSLRTAWHEGEADGAEPGDDFHRDATAPTEPPRRDVLRQLFFTFLAALSQLRDLARTHLRGTLAGRRHEPSAGLLLAFLGMYESVQGQINGFTDRHVDFYYQRCLGFRARPAQADHVHVAGVVDALAAPALVLPAGTSFVAGKDMAGQPLHFVSERAATLGDARVAALCTLRLQRDEGISPEAELGYVTGIRALRLDPAGLGEAPVPLFGGGPGSQEAALGLVVASPTLLLREGTREIELNLRLAWPRASQNELYARVLAAAQPEAGPEALRTALGALFACWMLSDNEALTSVQRGQLKTKIMARGMKVEPSTSGRDTPRVGLGTPLDLMCDDPRPEYVPRDLAFFEYMDDLFEVALTHERGWFTAERVQIGRPPRLQAGAGGLQMKIFLRPEDPPIVGADAGVHGSLWRTRLPMLRLQVSPRARIHPYSLFDGAQLLEAEVKVRVHEARDIVLQNNLGPLDPSKAFSPFGPLPTTSSYLVFGSPEAARKNLDSLALHVEWGGLPQEPGGFASHYRGYGPDQAGGRFTAALSILRDGQWQDCGGLSACQPLFAGLDEHGRLPMAQTIEIDSVSVRQHARASEVPLRIEPGTRDGLMRLRLQGPGGAFGHAAYPELLSEALTQQARRRWRSTPLPKAPYTPVIERIWIEYSASTTVRPGAERGDDTVADPERLLHIRPFGVGELVPDAALSYHGLLPRLEPDGSLCIGLRASRVEGPLSLLFELRGDEVRGQRSVLPRTALRWSWLDANLWRALAPRHVQADGTQGMLGSGIVELDLPALSNAGNTAFNMALDAAAAASPGGGLDSGLGDGLYWLRLACDGDLDAAAPLAGLHTQALTLRREIGAAGASDAPLPPRRITQAAQAITGLAGVLQPELSTGWRPAEDTTQMRVRAGERLRHKNRASLAWDIERLVLEAFPEVFKVKCLTPGESKLPRGEVRVVVVPHVRLNHLEDSTRAPLFNAHAIRRIETFLAEHGSPSAALRVCNPSYERVLVRCLLDLDEAVQAGDALRRVNRALVEYLSPWHDKGYGARFGWVLQCAELQSVVRAVQGVRAVGRLSLLHLYAKAGGGHRLGDTARSRFPLGEAGFEGPDELDRADEPEAAWVGEPGPGPFGEAAGGGGEPGIELRHHLAWSLALPMPEHLIAVAGLGRRPRATGVSMLDVGRTFVIGGGPA